MQDLQKLTDKLALLEDLVQSEEGDTSSLQGLMNNPTIGQMYRACRDELPKLLELANSELNEVLMERIINITERLTLVKNTVEKEECDIDDDNNNNSCSSNDVPRHFELKQSSDDIKNIFDDLPLLSPKPTTLANSITTKNVNQESFNFNNDLLVDLINVDGKFVLRVMNISDEKLGNLKLVRAHDNTTLIDILL